MEDKKIIELFWHRDENAIPATAEKYGGLCRRIAANILSSREDCEECVNDTYLGVWNAIPMQRPKHFSAFISRITRNLALKRVEYNMASKRDFCAAVSFEELSDCVSGNESVEDEVEAKRIERAINAFLEKLDREKRAVFLARYWYFESVESICARTGWSESKVKSMLFQTRKKLRAYLEREGVSV